MLGSKLPRATMLTAGGRDRRFGPLGRLVRWLFAPPLERRHVCAVCQRMHRGEYMPHHGSPWCSPGCHMAYIVDAIKSGDADRPPPTRMPGPGDPSPR